MPKLRPPSRQPGHCCHPVVTLPRRFVAGTRRRRLQGVCKTHSVAFAFRLGARGRHRYGGDRHKNITGFGRRHRCRLLRARRRGGQVTDRHFWCIHLLCNRGGSGRDVRRCGSRQWDSGRYFRTRTRQWHRLIGDRQSLTADFRPELGTIPIFDLGQYLRHRRCCADSGQHKHREHCFHAQTHDVTAKDNKAFHARLRVRPDSLLPHRWPARRISVPNPPRPRLLVVVYGV
jgi:hypothetical protein